MQGECVQALSSLKLSLTRAPNKEERVNHNPDAIQDVKPRHRLSTGQVYQLIVGQRVYCFASPFAFAFFFLAAHAFFMHADIFLRNAALFAADVLCFAATGASAGGVLGATATGAGSTATAFAALIAAQRFFVAAIIARRPAALSLRFAGAVGPTASSGFKSCSTDGTAFRTEPGGLPFRFVGP